MSKKALLQAKADAYLTRRSNAGDQLHMLYILEATPGQDANGLPTLTGQTTTQILPTPCVRLKAVMRPTPGGALEQIGDAEVRNLALALWPVTRLLAAVGFTIDSPTGELYQLVGETLVETGPGVIRFALKRMSQPRP